MKKIIKNKFIKNTFVLVGGTVIAQGLVIISSPILTRLYSPEAFGILATFISIIAILNSVVTLKYEIAIPLTRSNSETINLFVLNIILISTISIFYLFILILFGSNLFPLLGIDSYLNLLIWLIPITTFFFGTTNSLTYLFVKTGEFKSITNIKVNSTIVKVFSQLSFGLMPSFNFGMIAGDILGRIVGAFIGFILILRRNIIKSYDLVKRNLSINNMITTANSFKKFPLYAMPAGLINSLSTHLTPIVLISVYSPTVAGFYSLTQRVLGLPSALVSQSISQVYLNEAPKLLKQDIKLVRRLYINVTRNLILFGGLPILVVAIFGEKLFSIIFGNSWSESGIYLQVLGLMFFGQFIVVPLSQTLNILDKQNVQLAWDILRVIISVLTIIYPAKILFLEPERTLLIYSISMFILYVLLYFITLYYLSNDKKLFKSN